MVAMIALLALEVPCAMPMYRYILVPGTALRNASVMRLADGTTYHNSIIMVVFVIEEANIQVLQHSKNLQG